MIKSQSSNHPQAPNTTLQTRVGDSVIGDGWWRGLLLLALILFAYLPSLHNGFIWDDDLYVTHNALLSSWTGLWRIWTEPGAVQQYYPVVFTSFWVERHLWGLAPMGYHLVNVLLHAGVAVLAWRLLEDLEVPGAWWAAALFAVHPVHVESVAWITERKNVLSGVCYLAALWRCLRAAGCTVSAPTPATHWRAYLPAWGFGLAALLSKTVTATLSGAWLLLVWWKRGRLTWRDVFTVLPFVLAGLGLGLVVMDLEHHRAGAEGVDWTLSLAQRLLIAGRALWFYAGTLAWPQALTFIYPRWNVDPTALRWWFYPAAAGVLVSGLWLLRQRWGRGPLTAVLFFCGTLAPALGFINFYPMRFSFVADHFQYLASLGLLTLAAALGTSALRSRPALGRALGSLLLALLGLLTWRQQASYRNQETLWQETLAKNPMAWMAHFNLGVIMDKQGRLEEAIGHYLDALKQRPDDAQVYNNLGVVLFKQGKFDEAMREYREALRVNPRDPATYNNIGNVLVRQEQLDVAIAAYREALRLDPAFAVVHNNLGAILELRGQREEALAHYREALRIRPDFRQARENLQKALMTYSQITNTKQ